MWQHGRPLKSDDEDKTHYSFATWLRQGNVFTPVSHSVHRGGVWQTHLRQTYPLRQTHPPRQKHPPGRHTLLGRHPLWVDNPLGNPPPRQTPRPLDGHCSGRYASYWNAFLLRNENLLDRNDVWYLSKCCLIQYFSILEKKVVRQTCACTFMRIISVFIHNWEHFGKYVGVTACNTWV